MERGLLYVAFGRPYLAMAMASVASLKRHHEDIGVAIVSNVAPATEEVRLPGVDHYIHAGAKDKQNRLYKTQPHKYSPFKKTLFVDCDTTIMSDISDIFDYLDYYDIASYLIGMRVASSAFERSKGAREILGGKTVGSMPHWNSGVIAFRDNPAVHDLFDLWHERFNALGYPSDQPAFAEALFLSPLKQLSLDVRWNSPAPTYEKSKAKHLFKIIHYKTHFSPDTQAAILEADRVIENALGLAASDETEEFVMAREAKRVNRK